MSSNEWRDFYNIIFIESPEKINARTKLYEALQRQYKISGMELRRRIFDRGIKAMSEESDPIGQWVGEYLKGGGAYSLKDISEAIVRDGLLGTTKKENNLLRSVGSKMKVAGQGGQHGHWAIPQGWKWNGEAIVDDDEEE
jgi:hypothetical protein